MNPNVHPPASTPAVPLSHGGATDVARYGLTPPTSLATSQTNSFQTFDEYSQFLRDAVADEESLQFGESLQALATQIEAVMDLWRGPAPQPEWLVPELAGVLEGARAHHTLVNELGQDWHRYFEFDAHLAAVNQFHAQLAHWVQLSAWASATPPSAADFDLSAWRLLGAGALLLDVYEQSSQRHKSRTRRVVKGWRAWWQRCLGWSLRAIGRKGRAG